MGLINLSLVYLEPNYSDQDLLTHILAFLYSLAHYTGIGIVTIIKRILPMLKGLDNLVDPIGFLAIITILMILFSAMKKLAWIIVVIGWVLIIIRIIIMAIGLG